MKKLFLTLAVIVAATTFASSQLYVGGGVGFNTKGGSAKAVDGRETKMASTTSFNFTPRIGYYLNDNFSIGASLDVNYLKAPQSESNDDWMSITSFGLTPSMRYAFLSFGKFSVNIEAGFNLLFGSMNYKDKPSNLKLSSTTFGIFARPVLTYDLTKHITLETALNFCNLEFSTVTLSQKLDNNKATSTTNSFGIGADTNDVLKIGGKNVINIGFTYKF